MSSKVLSWFQGVVVGAKLIYDSRKTFYTFLNGPSIVQNMRERLGRYLVLSSTMIDLKELSNEMPEECLRYLIPPPDRKMMVFANLKMYGNKTRFENYCKCLNKTIVCFDKKTQKKSRGRFYKYQLYPDLVDVIIAPPYPYIETVANNLRKDCADCRSCEDCSDCAACKDCDCVNCKSCDSAATEPCCAQKCLKFDKCDSQENCQEDHVCQPKGTCQCNDCGICEFCQTCYMTDCADCSTCIQTGAQNTFPYISGGLSGEISPRQIRELGGRWVLIGSSERRELFQENDGLLMHKLRCALMAKLKVVYCISETCRDDKCMDVEKQVMSILPKIGLPDEDSDQTGNPHKTRFSWVGKQKKGYFAVNGTKDWDNVVFAYEPLWALKNETALSPQEAEKKCGLIREIIREEIGDEVADKVRILYGGPVSPETAPEYADQPSIDGFYVGTVAYKIDQLIQIANSWFIKHRPDAKDIELPDFGDRSPKDCIEDRKEKQEEQEVKEENKDGKKGGKKGK